jgi:hypothetical protein
MSRPRRIVPLVLLSALSAPAIGAPHPTRPPAPPPDAKAARSLLALRDELHSTALGDVRAHSQKYRPLCDAEGYPLVGNINDKGVQTQPSTWCADVRARLPKKTT